MTGEPGVNDSGELRALVREVIREVLPNGVSVTETVNLTTDQDLAAFVARLLDLEPEQRAELRSGSKRFRLAAQAASPGQPTQPTPPGPPQAGPAGGGRAGPPVRRIDTGAVTERMVSEAAQAGERLVLGSIDPKPAESPPAPVPASQSATRKKKASQ
jgi:hypothetical protein